MPFAEIGGLKLHYQISGRGPRLLYIGLTGDDLRARPNILDSPLAGAFTVLAYDQRGLGQSDKPAPPYAMADYAADVAGLLSAVGWERAAVLGVSFGGMVAQELALGWPEKVSRLVLACTSSGGAGGASYPLHELAALDEPARAGRLEELADLRRDAAWRAANQAEFADLVGKRLERWRVGAGEPGRAAGAAAQLQARVGHDTHDRLGHLAMPVLVAGGLYDGIAPPANQRSLADAIPGARLAMFEGGHWFLWQDPAAFQAAADFLASEESMPL